MSGEGKREGWFGRSWESGRGEMRRVRACAVLQAISYKVNCTIATNTSIATNIHRWIWGPMVVRDKDTDTNKHRDTDTHKDRGRKRE